MTLNGIYKLTYTVDDDLEELIVEVKLKPIVGLIQPRQNVYHGILYVNGNINLDYDLTNCVDAKIAVEEIGLELKDMLKKKFRSSGKSFRFKKEEIR